MAEFVYQCADEEATVALAEALAKITRLGDVWALYGTLGMGKSVWSRAFIKSVTNAAEVPSPTFTLLQTYDAAEFEIYHYDLYRLKSPDEIWELNMEEALISSVCLIEWPEKMGSYLPRDIFSVHITPWGNKGRIFEIKTSSPEKIARLKSCARQPENQNEC